MSVCATETSTPTIMMKTLARVGATSILAGGPTIEAALAFVTEAWTLVTVMISPTLAGATSTLAGLPIKAAPADAVEVPTPADDHSLSALDWRPAEEVLLVDLEDDCAPVRDLVTYSI